MEGTARINCTTASGESADIRAISTPAIDEDMLISFKDLETLTRIPIGFPNTVVEQCKCFEKARVVATTTKSLKEEFQDIISDELNPKPMNCTPMKIELVAGATPSKNMYTKRVPLPFEREAEKVFQDLIDKGVITRVHGPQALNLVPPGILPAQTRREKGPAGYGLHGHQQVRQTPSTPLPSGQGHPTGNSHQCKDLRKARRRARLLPARLRRRIFAPYTSLLPQGRFRYTRAPTGLNASSDE